MGKTINMRALRKKYKLSQKETALVLGYRSYFHYCLMEKGRRRIAARCFAFYADPVKFLNARAAQLPVPFYQSVLSRIKNEGVKK